LEKVYIDPKKVVTMYKQLGILGISLGLMSCLPESKLEERIAELEDKVAELEARPVLQGERGERGYQGETGPRGEMGIQGEVGAQGIRGERGEVGLMGMRGLQGERGYQGEQGRIGPRGEQGDIGLAGEQGIPGEGGPPGLPGETGVTGPSLAVYDSLGEKVGYLVDWVGNSNARRIWVFDTNIGKIVNLNLLRGDAGEDGVWLGPMSNFMYYASEDCSGTPYLGVSNFYDVVAFGYGRENLLTMKASVTVDQTPIGSFREAPRAETCQQTNEGTVYLAAEVEPIILPTYAGPLEIREE
jgi:hypothetical protein